MTCWKPSKSCRLFSLDLHFPVSTFRTSRTSISIFTVVLRLMLGLLSWSKSLRRWRWGWVQNGPRFSHTQSLSLNEHYTILAMISQAQTNLEDLRRTTMQHNFLCLWNSWETGSKSPGGNSCERRQEQHNIMHLFVLRFSLQNRQSMLPAKWRKSELIKWRSLYGLYGSF